jgi:hypothetical protein
LEGNIDVSHRELPNVTLTGIDPKPFLYGYVFFISADCFLGIVIKYQEADSLGYIHT